MHKKTQNMIRKQLHQADATVTDIAEATGVDHGSVLRALRAMPDTYIDRWTRSRRNNRLQAVWAAVAVPEDCPKP